MIDRTTLELRIAAHTAQTTRVNQGEWQRQGTTRHQGTTRQPLRMAATVALGLGLLTAIVFGQAGAAEHGAARPTGASVAVDYRWDFGAGQSVGRPVDASTATEYRWAFPAVTTAFVADPSTFREEYRVQLGGTTRPFTPDQFTFREDHRASAPALMASLMLDPTRCDCFA